MGTTDWKDLKKARYAGAPAELEKIEQDVDRSVLEMNLASLRELAGKSQGDVAAVVEMSQGELSRVERRSDHLVSTLRKIVEGLGGELEITAKLGNKSVRLIGV